VDQLIKQAFDTAGQVLAGLFSNANDMKTVENLVLNLAYDSYTSLDATCIALAINDTLFQLDTSRNINVHNLPVQQVADARTTCTANTYFTNRNKNVAATFEAFVTAMVKAANIPVNDDDKGETDLIKIIENIADTLRTGMYQECVSSAYNSVAIRDINSNKNIAVTGSSVFQNAEADVRNCINTMVAGDDKGSTVKGLAAEFAKQSVKRAPPGTYESGLVGCVMHYYWTVLAIGAFVLFLILLGLRYLAYRYLT